MSRERPIVAIDGPAGAGKSTVARKVAEALGFVLVDTGAMYRSVALAAKRAGVAWSDGPALGALAAEIVAGEALVFVRDPARGVRVKLQGDDVSEAIRTPEIGMGASTVSAHKEVRAALLEMQRLTGKNGNVVLEGRDIGTVVFPDAEVKFFLTARPEIRAQRRFDELRAKDPDAKITFEETLADVKRRDEQDTNRPIAPLKQAEGAVYVDTSDRTIEEVVASMADHVRSTMK
jgi:cytidylate kinase